MLSALLAPFLAPLPSAGFEGNGGVPLLSRDPCSDLPHYKKARICHTSMYINTAISRNGGKDSEESMLSGETCIPEYLKSSSVLLPEANPELRM